MNKPMALHLIQKILQTSLQSYTGHRNISVIDLIRNFDEKLPNSLPTRQVSLCLFHTFSGERVDIVNENLQLSTADESEELRRV